MTAFVDRTREPDEAFEAVLARFDAAPTPPEVWDQKLWDAIAALVPCHPEGDCDSDECECTANDVRDLMYRLAVAERYRQQADDPDDPEVNRVCCSMLVSNPFYEGATTPADAALAVFRDQQDPAVERVLREAAAELRSGGYEPAPSNGYPCFDCEDRVAEWLESRAGIGGDGR